MGRERTRGNVAIHWDQSWPWDKVMGDGAVLPPSAQSLHSLPPQPPVDLVA